MGVSLCSINLVQQVTTKHQHSGALTRTLAPLETPVKKDQQNFLSPHERPLLQACRKLSTDPTLGTTKTSQAWVMKKFLRQRGLTYTSSHPCLRVLLPSTILGGPQDPPVLVPTFLNSVTGSFVCPLLAATGPWQQFQQLVEVWISNRSKKKGVKLQDYPRLNKLDLKLPSKEQKLWLSARPVEQLDKEQFKTLLKNFRQVQRDFRVEDFARFDVRVEDSLKKMYFPVKYVGGQLVGLRQVMVENSKLEEEDLPAKGTGASILPFLHNLDSALSSGSTSCLLVGSVLDAVVLSARTNLQVVALPDLTNLHPDLLPFLEQFTQINLWLGNDVMSVDIVSLFSRKLGQERCTVVTAQYPSPLTAVRQKLEIEEILASARPCHHEFITTFEKLRNDVYLEFLHSEIMEGVKWKRFDGLNGLLRGFRRGEMTILTGRTGSGKTTFLSEYSLDLAMEGVNTLWGSFEVKNVRLIKMLLKQFSLVNLDEQVENFDQVADRFAKLPFHFCTFHGAQEVDTVMDAMAHAVYVNDIAHVIIDNVQFMIGSRSGNLDRMSQQDLAIEKFRKFATVHNVHVTLVIHPRKEYDEMLTIHSVYGGGKATQEADNVLLLQEEQTEGSFFKKKYVEIVKNRYAGDLGMVPLAFTKPFLTMSKKVADQARKGAKKKTMPLVEKKKNGDIVLESTETLIKPDDIQET